MEAVRLGHAFRALRRRRGWRQIDLAAAADVSRSVVARIELGRLDAMPTRALVRVATALGARYEPRLLWNGEALDRLLDEEHARGVDSMVGILVRHGWNTAVEVSFAIDGERGSVDVLAFHAASSTLVVVEVKSVVPDAGGTIHVLDRKTRLGRRIAAEKGWRPAAVGRILAISENRTARRRVAAHEALFRSAFPARGRDVTAWIRDPGDSAAPGGNGAFSGLYFLPLARPVNSKGGPATVGRWRVRAPRSRTASKSAT